MKAMVGFETEYLISDKDGKLIFPCGDHDDYPLLGECRGDPSEDVVLAAASLVAHIHKKKELPDGQTMEFGRVRVDLETHRESLRRVEEGHNKQRELDKCQNIYGSRVDDVDVIQGEGKERYAAISTGLHVHFSCEVNQTEDIIEAQYEPVVLPVDVLGCHTQIRLDRNMGWNKKGTVTARASIITKPVVAELVMLLDAVGFERGFFDDKSRYRRAGFWEPKPWGFEYRSYPADVSTLSLDFLAMIGKIGLDYLKGIEISCS